MCNKKVRYVSFGVAAYFFVSVMVCISVVHAEQVWDMSKTQGAPYAIYKMDIDNKDNGRKLLKLRIVLADKVIDGMIYPRQSSDDLGKEQLATTVIGAAKYYANASGIDIVMVILDSHVGGSYGSTIFAQCVYAPDGGGITGIQNWTYDMLRVQEKGHTEQQMRMQTLWGELQENYQTAQGITDEEALSKDIAQRMGIKPEDVSIFFYMPEDVPVEFAEKVAPMGALE